MTLKKINKKVAEIYKIKSEINKMISSLPDNPKFNRIEGTISAGTINIGDTDGIFCVFYHDFQAQYKKVTEIIDKTRPENITKALKKLTIPNTHGAYWYKRGEARFRFHPDVIANIKELL